jgi:hypothetical protein
VPIRAGVAFRLCRGKARLTRRREPHRRSTTPCATLISRKRKRDEVEAARQALAAVEAALPDPEHALREAEARVAQCADAVIAATSVAPLLARAQAAQDALVNLRVVLRYLLGAGLVSGPEADAVRRFLWSREEAIPGAPALGRFPSSTEHSDWNGHPASEPWKAARAPLAKDAAATLPLPE